MINNDWVGGYSWGNSEYAAGYEAVGLRVLKLYIFILIVSMKLNEFRVNRLSHV